MAIRCLSIGFEELALDQKLGLKDYSLLYKNGVSLKSLLATQKFSLDIKSGRTPSRFNEDYWNGDYDFITMSDVDLLTYCLNSLPESKITDLAIQEEKTLYQVSNNALLISNAMTLGLAFLADRKVYINQNIFEIKINEKKINKKFLMWYFNIVIKPLFQEVYTSKYLSKNEISRIKIPAIPKSTQDTIVARIEPIEQKIKQLKVQIIPTQEIVNKVFAREFGFDLEQFDKLKKIKNYYLDSSCVANNRDVRTSVKFHRNAGLFVMKELFKITNKKIKHFISESIVLGASISPKDYEDSGNYFYISMANIKSWNFDNEDAKLVSKEYSIKNQNKTVVENDILIARSGEGTIGKVALIDDGALNGIFADFTMRIRLKNYNPLFTYYYFRTEYFQYLIEINKKGLGNNTNIFPSQIQEFPIIDISVKEQQKIVNEIKAALDKQQEIKNKITQERAKIDQIIEHAISFKAD